MEILQASVADLERILEVQKLAYESEARLYDDWNIQPLTQSLAELKIDFSEKVFFKAKVKGNLVGSVRTYELDGHIGRLIVHPNWQGKGIGTALMRNVEKAFSHMQYFELFTGFRSENNIGFYQILGYGIYKSKGILVFMQKKNTI